MNLLHREMFEPCRLYDSIHQSSQVKEIIQARRGWIYKIDSVLGPQWNDGLTFMDFVRQTSVRSVEWHF